MFLEKIKNPKRLKKEVLLERILRILINHVSIIKL